MERQRGQTEMDRDGKQGGREGEQKLLEAELLVTVGHELRSPLTAIKGYASTLLRHGQRLPVEEQQEYLTAIQDASSRLEYVIDRLLEIGQFEQGAIRLQQMPTDVMSLSHDAIRTAELQAVVRAPGRFSFQLQVRDSAGFPAQEAPLVLADPLRVREVLDHLLSNAMTYSPEGGKIDVIITPVQLASSQPHVAEHVKEAVAFFISNTARLVQPNGKEPYEVLEICVCDHGQSIPTEHLDDIFERFYRVDTRLTRENNGLGLGLTLCKYIIEQHNGLIWAESCPAGGSAFHVWLPIAREEQQ